LLDVECVQSVMEMAASVASNPVRVLIADCTRLGTQLLVDALRRNSELLPIPAESAVESFSAQAIALKPDVAIVGAEASGSNSTALKMIRQARTLCPKMYSAMLLESSRGELIVEAFRAGVRGVICREDSLEVLLECIHAVHKGQIWARNDQLLYVLEMLAQNTVPLSVVDSDGAAMLSKRELDVVQKVAEGLTNREIASRLQLSEHTVKNYLFRIFDKLGVANRAELVSFAMKHCPKPQNVEDPQSPPI